MAVEQLALDDFLKNNRISQSDWDSAEMDFQSLVEIGTDHENKMEVLNKEAEYIAAKLQRMPEVHSVRWRVKDPEHLMEKIIRKRTGAPNKYSNITKNNYKDIITDLIGVRVLHLFKHEWSIIHEQLLKLWKTKEKPVAYVRSGDEKDLSILYKDKKCSVKVHKDGYRSVHYIISSEPTKDKVLCEIQVRTIFEEGWSEIDHKIRYPNFMNNPDISYFLRIFNRMAGSADEMGTFINILSANLKEYQSLLDAKNNDQNRLNREIASLLEQLNDTQASSESKTATILKLKNQIRELNMTLNSIDSNESQTEPHKLQNNQIGNTLMSIQNKMLNATMKNMRILGIGDTFKSINDLAIPQTFNTVADIATTSKITKKIKQERSDNDDQ